MISKAIQFVVPLSNRPGTMSKLCSALGKKGINIIAILVPEAEEGQIARVFIKTDDLAKARNLLKRARIRFSEEDVLDMEMDNRPGVFGELVGKLARAKINIRHSYATTSPFARARVIVGVSNANKALVVLTESA